MCCHGNPRPRGQVVSGVFSNLAFHKPADGHLLKFCTWMPHLPYPIPALTKSNRFEPGFSRLWGSCSIWSMLRS